MTDLYVRSEEEEDLEIQEDDLDRIRVPSPPARDTLRLQEHEEMVHGTSSQFLIEKIVRLKIYESAYWKEKCFGLTAKTLVDRAVELKYICGTFGGNAKPSKFLCLFLKMLQIQPEKEIVSAFLENTTFKYMRLLAAVYIRFVWKDVEVYNALEPLLADPRKVRVRKPDASFEIRHMDELIDDMLTKDFFISLSMPRLTPRLALQDAKLLSKRKSKLFEIDPEVKEILDDLEANSLMEIGSEVKSESKDNKPKSRNSTLKIKRRRLEEN